MKGFRSVLVSTVILLLFALCCSAAQADGTVLRLPGSVTAIETEAFCGDSSLGKVILPWGIEEIGERAFANSSLTQINLPPTLGSGSVADNAFANSSLQYVIANGDSWIASWAKNKGYTVIEYNELRSSSRDHENWVFVNEGETATLAIDFHAFDPEGIHFEWYRVQKDQNGNDVWSNPLPNGNSQTFVTVPIRQHETYVSRVHDAYGDQCDLWFDVMVDNDLRIWSTLENGQNWALAANSGDTLTLSVGASARDDSVMNFQWYRVGTDEWGNDDWITLLGETGTSLTTDAITGAARYVCRVTDCYGSMSDCWFFVDVDSGVNSVVSGPAFDVGSTDAWVPLTYSVSAATAEHGYRMGVAYSENAGDIGVDEDNRLTCMDWTWGEESNVSGSANGATYDGWLDEMIPGHTYWYSGCIVDKNGHVIFLEDTVRRFTSGNGSDVLTLTLNGEHGFALRGNSKTPFRFVAPSEGWYVVNTSVQVNEISVRRTDDTCCCWANDSDCASFHAGEGETVYLFTRDFEEDADVWVSSFEDPEDDAVRSLVDLSGEFPVARVWLDVTRQTAENDYGFGVEYSPSEDFDEKSSDFFWRFGDHLPRAEDVQESNISALIPGMTYYYRGFIDYCNGNRLTETEVKQFTAEGEIGALPTLSGEWISLPADQEILFRFTAESEGFYAVEADGMNWFNILDEEGLFIRGTNEIENDEHYAAIAVGLSEGESMYVCVCGGNNGGQIRVTDPVGVIRTFSADSEPQSVWNNRFFCFTAETAGWYNLRTNMSDFGMKLFPLPNNLNVQFPWYFRGDVNVQSFQVQQPGETMYFIAWYNEDWGDLWVSIEPIETPEEDSIVVRGEPEVGDTWANIDLVYSVSEATQNLACQREGYLVGVVYSDGTIGFDENGNYYFGDPDQEFTGLIEEWGWDARFSVENGAELTRRLDRLVPGRTYHYFAFLRDQQTGEIFAHTEPASFTTTPISDRIITLTLGNPVDVPAPDGEYQDTVYRFVPAQTGIYAMVSSGLVSLEIRDGSGEWMAGDNNDDWDDDQYPYCQGFIGMEGEEYYIFVGNHFEGVTLSVEYGDDVLPELDGTWSEWRDGRQVFRFTPDATGWYRFEFDGTDWGVLAFAEPGYPEENGWPRYGEGNEIVRWLEENVTVYPGCWFDNEWARVRMRVNAVEPAEQLSIRTLDAQDISDVSALFGIELGMPALSEDVHYTYGINLMRDDGKDFAGGEEWHEVNSDMSMFVWNQTAPLEQGYQYFFDNRPLEPGTDYWYEAVVGVYDPETDSDVFTFGGLKHLTTEALHADRLVRDILADEDVFLPHMNGEYQILNFTVPGEDTPEFYRMWVRCSIWVIEPSGYCLWPSDEGDGRSIMFPGRGYEGQTFKIYVREWDDNGETTRLDPLYADEVFVGARQELETGKVYRFTTPTDGEYLIGATDGGRINAYVPDDGGFNHWTSWGWIDDTNQEGVTILFKCEQDNNRPTTEVVITPLENVVANENALISAVAAANQIAEIRPYFEGFNIHLNDNVALTQDLELSTVVQFHINAALTIQSGITLTDHSDIYVNQNGSLIVAQNGTLVLTGVPDEWWAGVVLSGGTMENSGTIEIDFETAIVTVESARYPGLSMEQLLAMTSGIPNNEVQLYLNVDSDASLAQAAELLESYRYVSATLVNDYEASSDSAFESLEAFQGYNHGYIAVSSGSGITVPIGKNLTLYTTTRLDGGTITVNGTLNVVPLEDGEEDVRGWLVFSNNDGPSTLVNNGTVYVGGGSGFSWYGPSAVTNNGTMHFADDSCLLIQDSKTVASVSITNTNGTVEVGALAEWNEGITFDGGTVNR